MQVELLQQEGDVLLGSGVARQNQPPSTDRRDPDIDHVNGGECLQDVLRKNIGGQRDIKRIAKIRW